MTLATSLPRTAEAAVSVSQPSHQQLQASIKRLEALVSTLRAANDPGSKLELLREDEKVQAFHRSCRAAAVVLQEAEQLSPQHTCMIFCLPAIDQEHVLLAQPTDEGLQPALLRLAEALMRVDDFFDSLGGLPWYQLRCLRFIADAAAQQEADRSQSNGAAAANGLAARSSNGSNGSVNGSVSSAMYSSSNDLITGHGINGTDGGNAHKAHNGTGMGVSGTSSNVSAVHGSSNGSIVGRTQSGATGSSSGVNGSNGVNGIHGVNSNDSTGNECGCDGAAAVADGEQTFHMPCGVNLEQNPGAARRAAAQGLQALPYMAEIYPIGGAGDRLGLIDEGTGESLPTAVLPYCGRTLLEGLLRDLQAREYLHWRLTGRQITTPVALMTSDAKGNHRRLVTLLESLAWFGRGADSFRLFRQPMVPVVGSAEGRWPLAGPLAPMMKPGGHGAIWKLMLDEGVFDWLAAHRREAAIVRQISNPLAGTDSTLLALSGIGYMGGKLFGFASCPRAVGAAEGMNVLSERRAPAPPEHGGGVEYAYGITNIEYTEFKRLGIQDEAQCEGSQLSVFPANTNVLYLGLKAAEAAVRAGAEGDGGAALPGLIFNGSKCVEEPDLGGGPATLVPAGRLECTMQNLADSLAQQFPGRLPPGRHADLQTFVMFNSRRKVTSSAKRRRRPGSNMLAQTPDGSFRDLMANARALLLNNCGFASVPEVGEVQEYLEHGPGFIFLYHPALGPLWDVIGQKVRGGELAPRAELVLEVAAAALYRVRVDGSLLIRATAPLGHMQAAAGMSTCAPLPPPPPQPAYSQTSYDSLEGLFFDDTYRPSANTAEFTTSLPSDSGRSGGISPTCSVAADERLVFSPRCGRIRLTNVTVVNAGIDWDSPDNVYWRHMVSRRESARITLHGNAEFEASDVVLAGDCAFDVPAGYRMRVVAGPGGGPLVSLEPLPGGRPTWDWAHDMAADGSVSLTLRESPCGGVSGFGGSDSNDAPLWVQRANGSGNGSDRAHVNGSGGGVSMPSANGKDCNGGNGSSSARWPSGAAAPGASQQECDPSWLSSQL